MVKVTVPFEHISYLYDLLGRREESYLEICDPAEDISLFVSKSKAVARAALRREASDPVTHPLRPAIEAVLPTSIASEHGTLGASERGRDEVGQQSDLPPRKKDGEGSNRATIQPRLDEGERSVESGVDPKPAGGRCRSQSDSFERRSAFASASLCQGQADATRRSLNKRSTDSGPEALEGDVVRPAKAARRMTQKSTAAGRVAALDARRNVGNGLRDEDEHETRETERSRDGGMGGGHSTELQEADGTSRAAVWLREQVSTATDDSVSATSAQFQRLMVRTAADVAGPSSIETWQQILGYWRERGSLATAAYEDVLRHLRSDAHEPVAAPRHPLPPSSRGQARSSRALTRQQNRHERPSVEQFRKAYETTETHNIVGLLQPIVERCALANMYASYNTALGEVESWYGARPNLNRRDARIELFRVCNASMEHVEKPWASKATKLRWNHFDYMIRKGRALHFVQARLGMGCFSLLPLRVSNRWLARTLSVGQLELWVELVKQHNPRYQSVEGRAGLLLQRALSGKSLSTSVERRLLLERVSREAAANAQDPGQLFEVDDPTVRSDTGTRTPRSRPATAEGREGGERAPQAIGGTARNIAETILDMYTSPIEAAFEGGLDQADPLLWAECLGWNEDGGVTGGLAGWSGRLGDTA